MDKRVKFIDLKRAKKNEAQKPMPTAQEVPTLVSDEVFKVLSENDADPFFIVEAIDFPIRGDGGIYTRRFFESYINKMAEHPFGGSKDGHYNSRNDFYTIGGRVDLTSENEGVAYFKIYAPKMDADGSPTGNAGFIRDCKAGYVNFSLTTIPEYIETDASNTEDDFGNYMPERLIIGTLGEERNDSVGYERARMPQRLNDNEQNEIIDLINKGFYFTDKTDSDEIIQNGKVSRVALDHIISRGNAESWQKKALGAIDRQENKRRGNTKDNKKRRATMDKQEILEAVKNAIRNNTITLNDVAEEAGLEEQLKDKEDDARAELVKKITEKLEAAEEDILERIAELLATEETAEEVIAEGIANSMVGSKTVINAQGKEEANPSYEYVMDKLKGKHGKALKIASDALKNDNVLLALVSKQNDIGFNKVYTRNNNGNNNNNTNDFLEV
jgi:hypothetical protein